MVENTIGQAIQAFALLIPVVLEGSRMKVTDDAGDVNIGTLEDLPRKGRPKVGLLTIPESLELYQPAVGDKPQSPVLLLAAEYVDQAYILNGLVVNVKITTPSSCDDSTRKSQFVLLLPIQVDVIRGPGFGNRVPRLKGRSRKRSFNRKPSRFPAWRAGTTGGATITFSSMSMSVRGTARRASAGHDHKVKSMRPEMTQKDQN